MIDARGIGVRAGELWLFDDLDFSVDPGECAAIVGPNGVGKSTLLRCFYGMQKPQRGRVLVDGRAPDERDVEFRRKVSVLFDDSDFFADLTPLQHIVLAVSQREDAATGWWRPLGSRGELVDEAEALLQQLGLIDVRDQRTATIAYGKQRLLEIAVALAGKPAVLLLDEPAAGVPEAERHQILDVIAQLPDSVTLVLIEHDMQLVFRFARTISVLVNGGLFVEGPAADIARDPRVKKVYLGEELVDV